MKWCLVFACKNKGNIEGVHYFRLTKRRFSTWVRALNRDPTRELLSEDNVVCSNHFRPDDFEIKNNKLVLKEDAVPSCNMGVRRSLFSVETSEATTAAGKPATSSAVVVCEAPASTAVADFKEPLHMEEEMEGAVSIAECCESQQPKTVTPATSTSSDSVGLRHSAKKRRKYLRFMHSYNISPRKLKASCEQLKQQKNSLKRKLKASEGKRRRLKARVQHLSQITRTLKKTQLMSNTALEVLEKSFSGIPLALMKRLLATNGTGKVSRTQYPKELRSFAMTLQFYSRKAYEYVRKTFNLSLPSQSIIRQWLSNVECTPGFSTPAFASLKEKANKQPLLCAFMLDEMHIKKQIDFIGQTTWGYEDMGTGIIDDALKCATQALVFMVVAVKDNWKVPIAYYLINSLTASEKANIVLQALSKLQEIQVQVTSITCDGPTVNFAMATELGAKLHDLDDLQPYFQHPVTQTLIFIIFDNCHMLKLLRNFWATQERFVDPDGNIVDYKYIKLLYALQEEEGLRLGTKLRKSHVIEWQRQKMKVKLATQLLSKSVADAIAFLQEDINHPDFVGAGPTIKFIRLADQVFDLLNSRNPVAMGSKSPLHPKNEVHWRPFLESAVSYFTQCKSMNGTYLHATTYKTTFRGYIITISSFLQMYQYYIKRDAPLLKYILTYKFSQDHLELFFCSVRARNGSNNNPTAFQFYHTYKRLLLHHDIKNMTGSCTAQDETNILLTTTDLRGAHKENIITIDDIALIKKYNIDITQPLTDHDYDIPLSYSLTTLVDNVIAYISGFVIRVVKKQIKCPTCILELESVTNSSADDSYLFLIRRKDMGGLLKPSVDVMHILRIVEIQIRKLMTVMNNTLPPDFNFFKVFVETIAIKIFGVQKVFQRLIEHTSQASIFEDNHIKKLITAVISSYVRIRFFNLAKKETEIRRGELLRKHLSKQILFLNQ